MKLSAIVIENHEYLIDKPQLISFGGKFKYKVSVFNAKTLRIDISLNENYIENFFSINGNSVENFTAIVGKNGTGKTTLLNLIRGSLNNDQSLPHNNSLIILEDEGDTPFVWSNGVSKRIDFYLNNVHIPLDTRGCFFKAIYYSPIFNYSYNQDFDIDYSLDISFDSILYQDLVSSQDLAGHRGGGSGYSPNEELIFKNTLRQIEFLNSDFVKDSESFKSFFNIKYPSLFKIYIRSYKQEDDFEEWNTPMGFRGILKEIQKLLREEIGNWTSIREFDENDRVKNQVDINKYLLKRYCIRDFIFLFFYKMEESNTYLSEGKIEYREDEMEDVDAITLFKYFLKNAKIRLGSNIKNVFNYDSIEMFLDKLYLTIDKVTLEEEIDKDFVYVNYDDLVELLNLQKKYLNDLTNYFYLFYKEENKEIGYGDRVNGLLHVYPSDKKLSSGQHSFLNLFSRIYECIEVFKSSVVKDNNHYILLLDEGDLTFHPEWKRRYVSTVIEYISEMFKALKKSYSLEIIITTHDALTLSDIPAEKINYLESISDKTSILTSCHEKINIKTFGANINELLAESFFIDDGLIGDFAKQKIQDVIEYINHKGERSKKTWITKPEVAKKMIEQIGELYLADKLNDMFLEEFPEFKNDEIVKLEERLKQLKYGTTAIK